MKLNFYEGENVRHKAKAEWGIGKIIEVNSCGTIKVIFEGTKEVSIAQGSKFLVKVDKSKN
jgi:transcription elongation factor GreA-like protein